MLPTRYGVSVPSSMTRKSRLDGKPSLLPKPRVTSSIDRYSTEARRPSATGGRSSSAEAPRATVGARPSRDASASKSSMNARSRSQQVESRYGQSMSTPLRASQYCRLTTTPMRTPADERSNRSWEASLERALAFVTIKDQRPLSNAAWQRTACARVSEALAERMEAGAGALMRPLTIARFVDITGALISVVQPNPKLTSDNYIGKLPNLCKKLLYPGTLSKSWLRTVNTLHAFPHALALIAYLLDLANHVEMPVPDDWLYVSKDEHARLRREFLYKCWLRFQEPEYDFKDLDEEYLQKLKKLLGDDEKKIAELQQIINKYESEMENDAATAARAAEARLMERRDALQAELRAERAARLQLRARLDEQRDRNQQLDDALRRLHQDLDRANAEKQRLREEVAQQPMSANERARLLDTLNYSLRVLDSKRALADQISQMVQSKEMELATWQQKTLYDCVKYKQSLIQLAAQFPELSDFAIDENELMSASCADKIAASVAALQQRSGALGAERARRNAHRADAARRHQQREKEIEELKLSIEREQEALEKEEAIEAEEAAAWSREEELMNRRIEEISSAKIEHAAVASELELWEKQDEAWRSKLSEMREYIAAKREEAGHVLRSAHEKRAQLVLAGIRQCAQHTL
ncbi:kinetochore protein NDC80 homolog [Battus philenor]|uniref:kinetochore protein NDC80 homolog n=1 Tax=Battus philenor TaxID=42288 RepID=UPI0035CEF5AC